MSERQDEWAKKLRGPIHNYEDSAPEMRLAIDHIIYLEDQTPCTGGSLCRATEHIEGCFATGQVAVRSGACWFCGHTHPTMAKGTKTIANGETVTRHYCHEDDHSCYQDNMGRLFE